MSVQQQLNQSNIENGRQQHEEIPLQRMDSTPEHIRRIRLREIFDKYDHDQNGHLDVKELKRLIKSHQCKNLPKGLARRILQTSDTNNDNQLDFEEFYNMSKEHDWLFKEYVAKYCKLIVPSPHRGTTFDEPDGTLAGRSLTSYGTTLEFDQDGVKDGAYEQSMSCWPPPLTMVMFSLVEIIIFLYDVIKLNDHRDKDIQKIGLSTKGPAAQLFIYHPFRREEAWRFFTYMFVHVGVMHLVMNLIVQIFLGTALELVHSWWRVALVYIAGVVAGSMGTSISDPKIFLAGASGGVYALITAHIATIILNWQEMEYAAVQLFVFLIFCTVDLGTSIYNHVNNKNDQIGYIAHLCGAVAGLLIGIGVLRNLNVRSWEKVLWWVAVIIFSGLMIAGICIHIFVPSHFPTARNYL